MDSKIYNDPIVSKRRKGDSKDPFLHTKETLQVVNGRAILTEIPNRFNKVKVTGFSQPLYEINEGELSENLFKVDYVQGIVFFYSTLNNYNLTFEYLGEGVILFPDSRVYLSNDKSGLGTVDRKFQDVDRAILEQKARVDEQLTSVPQPSEVVDMRIDHNGKRFTVAKDRIDAEQIKIENAYKDKNNKIYSTLKERIDAEQIKIESAYRDAHSNVYPSLKDRIDAEQIKVEQAIDAVENLNDEMTNEFIDRAVNVKSLGAIGDGVHDDTTAIQNALDNFQNIYFPNGTFLTGSLLIPSNRNLIGSGSKLTVLLLKEDSGYQAAKYPAIIRNKVMPTYWDSNDLNKGYQPGLAVNISVKGITLDAKNSKTYYNAHFASVDNLFIDDVEFINGFGALDLRAIRHGRIYNCYADNIATDGYSISGENFNPTVAQQRWSTKDVIFDNCYASRCGLTNTNTAPDGNAFELDDGAIDISYFRCVAEDNTSSGFDIHIHEDIYDIANVRFVDCVARRNKHKDGTTRSIAGFHLGQCPETSYLGDILYDNCISEENESHAFVNYLGAQKGYKQNVTIKGGKWKSSWGNGDFNDETDKSDLFDRDGLVGNMKNANIYLRRYFKNFKIVDATIEGASDGYGIFTYGEYGELTIENTTFKNMYAPMRLGHYQGYSKVSNCTIVPSPPRGNKANVMAFIFTDETSFSHNDIVLDANNYNSHIVRLIGVKNFRVDNNKIINQGTKANNSYQIDNCDTGVFTSNISHNFNNFLHISNVSQNISLIGNNAINCTNLLTEMKDYIITSGNFEASMKWQEPQLLNNWTKRINPDGSNSTCKFMRRDGNLYLHVTASAKENAGVDEKPIFILPQGYRPSNSYYFPVSLVGTSETSRCAVKSNGEVSLSAFSLPTNATGIMINTVIPMS